MSSMDAYKHAVENEDVDSLIECYADDAELVMMDNTRPPSSPAKATGRDLPELLRDIYSRDMSHELSDLVVDEHAGTAAFVENCVYRADGLKVVSANLIELNDEGKITKHTAVQAWG